MSPPFQIGCGWTQFPIDSFSPVQPLLSAMRRGDDDESAPPRYENFFVCNYGVGGNVRGEPVFDCPTEEEEEETSLGMSRTLDPGLAENLADGDVRGEVARCLEAIACLSSEDGGGGSCSGLLSSCLPSGLLWSGSPDQVLKELAECRIEQVLCRLSQATAGDSSCDRGMSLCVGQTALGGSGEEEPEAVTPPFGTTTTTTTTEASTANTPTSERSSETESDVTVAPDSDEEEQASDTGKADDTASLDAKPTDDVSKVDLTYYEDAQRDGLHLMACLEAANCQDRLERCEQVQIGCAAGLRVTDLPPTVRRKLSECLVDDILCHLNGGSDCKNRFVACADIVIPNGIVIQGQPLPETAGEIVNAVINKS